MGNQAVITVKGVRKDFYLPREKNSSIKTSIVGAFKRRDKTIETQHALKGVSFEIKKGEFYGILGRNGSGKSTLLKILAEIYQPTGGAIEVRGKLVPFIELGVGFNPELTGRENVYLNGALLGFSKKEIDDKYNEIVEFAELEKFMDQKLKNYSSGMQVRLAFSVATRADADILLVDEVLAVGDADFQRKCFDYFKSLKKSGKTVVFVTHDMNAARDYCDRAILIKNGKIAYEGTGIKAANEYLKLFNTSTQKGDAGASTEKNDRWGNGDVTFSRVEFKPGKRIELTMDITAHKKDVDGVVVGLRYMDESGRIVTGVNSITADGGEELNLKAGETRTLRFSHDNIFGNGTYYLGSTIRLTDKVTICEYWDNIAKFHNTMEDSFYPLVNPTELKIETIGVK